MAYLGLYLYCDSYKSRGSSVGAPKSCDCSNVHHDQLGVKVFTGMLWTGAYLPSWLCTNARHVIKEIGDEETRRGDVIAKGQGS